MTKHNGLTLVLGGTGKTGHRVVARLRQAGLAVRVGSRSNDPSFDWADESTWASALDGVTAAYISYYPDLAVPGAAERVSAFADLAVSRGVRRLVLLSGRGEEQARLAEAAIQNSTVEWTILRASWFNQNFDESYLLYPVLAGEVALPVGPVGEPFVDVEDIAEIAADALATGRHAGRLYELTGPRLLTFADAVSDIADATGRDIRFVPVTIEQYAAALNEQEVPAEIVNLLTYLFTEVLDGRNAHLTTGVQEALGRPPKDFRDFARAAAATGVWNVAS